MKIFDDSVTDRVAEQFCLYFQRKRLGKKMTYRDAEDIIRYIGSSSSPPTLPSAIDYTEPSVQGGGKSPPGDIRIMRILESMTDANEWDSVFNEILALHSSLEDNHVIMLYFDEMKSTAEISDITGIHERMLQRMRLAILTKSAVLAGRKNLINIFFACR